MFLIVIAAILISFIALEIVLINRWRGPWRIMACLPAAAVAAWAAVIVVSIVRDPTSHNLWPLELVLWSAGALAALGLLALIKRLTRPRA